MGDDQRFWPLLLFQMAQVAAAAAVVVLALRWTSSWTGLRVLGFLLLLGGMALVFTARMQLGSSFSLTPQARRLVTHGLYSRIRNPIYTFGMVAIAGMLLIWQNPWAWILLPVLALAQMLRARREAAVLEAKFGEEYRAYRRQTWF
jgi:protein-S-isoprenylcysteine O-methyltransferase Ste14